MGIKLDWEIDARQGNTLRVGEDPDSKRQRRVTQFRFLLVLAIFVLAGAAIIGIVLLRLREVDGAIQRQLHTTVGAEVTALRLGDLTAFLDVQWRAEDTSLTEVWIAEQTRSFDAYQALKQDASRSVNLTGRIIDTTIESQNGRVHVEEIVDGIPYGRVWFYWRFDEGWRHVPPAYGFWGQPHVAQGERFRVSYQDVDAPIAAAIAAELPRWIELTCGVFDCAPMPEWTVEIVPDDRLVAGWAADGSWRLRLPSPYIERARLDQPFDPSLKVTLATLWVDRWLSSYQASAPSDAAYLRDSIGSYLIEQLAGIDTGAHLLTSLADNYSVDVLRRIMLLLSPQTTIAAVGQAANQPLLGELNADWRDFLAYRLRAEAALIGQRAETAFYALYDTTDSGVMATAQSRFASGPSNTLVEVESALPEQSADGTVTLRATVIHSGGAAETVLFRLVEGVWKRAS
ncbi:MAG: hypothetical protein IPK19_35140 [Chloroflexi bacterium]|nr:hypothetical protein [Chloroflexota bacterium]